MNKQKRTYLEMQHEEATLDSGRYNVDYDLTYSPPSAADTLIGAYRRAAVSFGLPFGQLSEDNGPVQLSDEN